MSLGSEKKKISPYQELQTALSMGSEKIKLIKLVPRVADRVVHWERKNKQIKNKPVPRVAERVVHGERTERGVWQKCSQVTL